MPTVLRLLFMARIPGGLTWRHFCSAVGRKGVALLTCPIHQGLIPQGEHLTKLCAQWVPRREIQEGWCPEGG